MCLGKISGDFSANNIKTGSNGCVHDFSADYKASIINYQYQYPIVNINICKYLMKKHKRMSWLIKKMFIGLLTSIVSASNHTRCMLLSNQKWTTQPTLVNLHPNEYSQ